MQFKIFQQDRGIFLCLRIDPMSDILPVWLLYKIMQILNLWVSAYLGGWISCISDIYGS